MKLLNQYFLITLITLLCIDAYPQIHGSKAFSMFKQQIRDTSSFIFTADSMRLDYISNIPRSSRKYYITVRNDAGKMTEAEEYRIRYHDPDTNWSLFYQYNTEYYDNGNIKEFKKDYWHPDSNAWVVGVRQFQKENGQVTEYISNDWSEIWPSGGYKLVYSYNEYDSLTELARYGWTPGEEYTKYERKTYSYNSIQRKSQKLFQVAEDDEWLNRTLIDYYYTDSLCTEWMIYTWMINEEEWRLQSRRLNVYNEDGEQIQYTYYHMQPDSSWRPSSKFTFAFNEFGELMYSSEADWDTLSTSWTANFLSTYDYHYDTLFFEYTSYKWREDTGIYENSFKQKHLYDDQLNVTHIYNMHGSWSTWDTFNYYAMEYDYLDRRTSYRHFDWLPWHREIWREIYWWDQTVTSLERFPAITNRKPRIYPNPSYGKIIVEFEDGDSDNQIVVYNQLGMELQRYWQDESNRLTIRLNSKPGIYFVRITNKTGTTTHKVLVI